MEQSTRAHIQRFAERFEAMGYPLGHREIELLEAHCALIREWNGVCSVVSEGDLNRLWERHILDSLRVACCVAALGNAARSVLDVGSGGGYPGIVLKVVLHDVSLTMLERSEKKVGFLRRVVGSLALQGLDIVCGEFPKAAADIGASVLTARAVENPKKVAKGIAAWLGHEKVFLCQTDEIAAQFRGSFHVEHVEKRFHVEQFEEPTFPGLELRGPIYLIRSA